MSKAAGWGNICNRVDTCALTGAGAFIAGIPDSEILVNGPLWCYFYALRYLERVYYNMGERFHGSQPDNNAVVYGAEKYVTKALQRLVEEGHKPSVMLIESSCSMSLIGDDLAGIARKSELDFPVVTMDCGGMIGGYAEGYCRAALKVFELLLPNTASALPKAVNILGQTDFYLGGSRDTKEICRLLKKAGYDVLTVPGSGSTVDELRRMGEASLNIVTNEELGLPLAEYLERKYGTPYITAGIPYGIEGTVNWLKKIHSILGCDCFSEVCREAEELFNSLTSKNNEARLLWGSLWFDEVLVSGPSTMALCLAQTLRTEWADMGKLTVICQEPLKQSLYCEAADAVYTVGRDDAAVAAYLEQCNNVLLLGSSSESSVLYRRNNCKFQSCNIAYPANDEIFMQTQPMAGLRGCGYMLQRLWNTFIAGQIRKQGEQ